MYLYIYGYILMYLVGEGGLQISYLFASELPAQSRARGVAGMVQPEHLLLPRELPPVP